MDAGRGPRVVVGVDYTPQGLAALRAAVGEAARRGVPLYAIRVDSLWPGQDFSSVDLAFAEAFGGFPPGVEVHRVLRLPPVIGALVDCADQPGDLLVLGTSRRGWWHAVWSGSIARACLGKASCPMLVVPALARPEARRRWWHRPSRDLWVRFERETADSRG
jgi:nucleotide-binding universal stress UspA family protein